MENEASWLRGPPQAQHEQFTSEVPLVAPRSDPPGYEVPEVRQMEWWIYRQKLQQQEKLELAKRRELSKPATPQIPYTPESHPTPGAPNITPNELPQSHSYKEYIRTQRKKLERGTDHDDNESTFSWIPPPARGQGGQLSPLGIPSNYRSREAQQVFDSSVPKRAWSIDKDEKGDGPSTRTEQDEGTMDYDSSWVMPRPTTTRYDKGKDSKEKENIKDQKDVFHDEEEIIEDEEVDEEVLVDDDGNTIEEETLEEDVTEDDHEVIEEEVSASSQSSTSEDTHELFAKNNSNLNMSNPVSQSNLLTTSDSNPNSFMPPGDMQKLSARGQSIYSSMSSSHESSKSHVTISESTETSGSTQVIYIRDPRDVDEIVKKCFDGGQNVQIVDDPNPPLKVDDDDSDFVPSQQLLIALGLLVTMVALSIVLGVSIYFKK